MTASGGPKMPLSTHFSTATSLLFSPYLAGFARRPCHPALRECFRVSQNLVKKPPLADERELATTDLFVKYTAHSRSAAPFPPYVPYCRLRAFEARAMNTKPLPLAHTQPREPHESEP